jgi:signal transduction histidine kinase
MSAAPALLVRRWPERRPVVLAAGALGLAAVAALVQLARDPALGVLYVLPVLLVALELGLAGGLAAAAIAAALALAGGAVLPAAVAIAVGAVAGRFSSRMHAVHEREQRLLESAIALGERPVRDRLPQAVAAAALRTRGATGAEVTLDGRRAIAGGRGGHITSLGIVVRGELLGAIELSHRRRLEPEDRAALELLAVQAGLAADNQRLLIQEREAAAIEAELRHIRDDLLEQRAGLGQLLDAQEDERRRHAETLHEELAQVLAGVLMQLRLRRGDDSSLEELHNEVRGVLAELRDVATELRPSSLAQLGLVPALEAIGGLAVEADSVPDPVPEPLRTGVYRLVEHVLSAATAGARVQLQGHDDRLDVIIDAGLTDSEPVAAARARVALLGGTLATEARPDGRTRLLSRLPMRHALRA